MKQLRWLCGWAARNLQVFFNGIRLGIGYGCDLGRIYSALLAFAENRRLGHGLCVRRSRILRFLGRLFVGRRGSLVSFRSLRNFAGGVPDRGLGFAIKVLDGGRRAVEVALVQTLADLGVFDEEDVSALSHHGHPDVINTRGEVVGEVRSAFSLEGEAA